MPITIDFFGFLIILVALSLLGFFIFIYFKRPVPDQDQNDSDKSYDLINRAIKKAQEILGNAELDAIKITADAKFYKEKLEKEFQQEVTSASSANQQMLKNQVELLQKELSEHLLILKSNLDKAGKDYSDYISYLKTDADGLKNQNQDMVKAQVAQIFVKLEENLTQYFMETQQKSVQSIELELKAARGLIETYKQQQLKIIDENVIAMLEKTLSLVLAKKLNLQDQTDLVYEALEKAKAEKFII